MPLKFLNIDFGKRQNIYLISIVVVSLIFLDVFQDFIHAKIYDEGFYFSESFIFKFFWALFIPLTFLISFLVKKELLKINAFLLIKLLFISVFHVAASALIIVGLYATILEIDFRFIDVFKELIGLKLYLSLLILGAITFIINVKKQKSESKPKNKNILIVKDGKITHNVTINMILFVEANTPYITIVSESKKYSYNSSLTKFLSIIDNPNFIRIHKKYIVNKDFILKLKSRSNGDYDVILKNNEKIRLSRTFRKNLFTEISNDSIDLK